MPEPLEGVVILDLTHVWAGPLGTRVLADLGAEVIKIEALTGRGPASIRPGTGGAFQGGPGDEPYNRQAGFNKLNRNKKSVAIDLKTGEGRAVFLDLARRADAVIENFSARAMKSLRLDYAELKKVNPDIIYVAMPGYGTWGPISDYVAFGPSVELMTGLTSVFGYNDEEPRPTAMALPDAIAGTTAAAAVVTALLRRHDGGKGGFVDLALHEAAITMLGEFLVERQLTGRQPPILGNRHRSRAPQGVYPCRPSTVEGHEIEGWIFISCGDEDAWRRLSTLAGGDWHRDPDFATAESRRVHHDRLDALIAGFTAGCDKTALMSKLQEAGISAGAVMVTPEFMADPQVVERGYFVELGDDTIPPLPFPGSPVIIDGERHAGWRRAPRLGEHNEQVLTSLLGYSIEQVDQLLKAGVLADRPPE